MKIKDLQDMLTEIYNEYGNVEIYEHSIGCLGDRWEECLLFPKVVNLNGKNIVKFEYLG